MCRLMLQAKIWHSSHVEHAMKVNMRDFNGNVPNVRILEWSMSVLEEIGNANARTNIKKFLKIHVSCKQIIKILAITLMEEISNIHSM